MLYGTQQVNGFQLGLEYATKGTMTVAGRPIEVIIKDTGGKAETGAAMARELIEKDGVDLLQGAPSSSVTLAIMEVAKANKKILMVNPAASPAITGANFNEFTFRTSRTSVQDALTMGGALVEQYKGPFVQIAPDNAFGRGSAAGFYAVVKAKGGQFTANDTAEGVGSIFIPADATDFSSYINQVLAAKAKVLIVTWAGASFLPLFQQMTDAGVFDSMTVATGVGDNATFKAVYSGAIGVVGVNVYHYTLPKTAANDWLVAEHMKRFNSPPDLFTEGGFSAAQAIVAALEKTGGDATAEKMIPALEGLSFEGPKGTTTFRKEDHVALQPLYLVKIIKADDPEFKNIELIKEYSAAETTPPCAVPAELKRCAQ
ncbi:substrate-binding domain-containing protein [Candidatus Amarolinea dominans]|uniref:substrate-binding domain-containing protein n=1 Tax=Candidatus Amarolinea dominans TaxID=3140696 RepID=UPI0031CCBB0E